MIKTGNPAVIALSWIALIGGIGFGAWIAINPSNVGTAHRAIKDWGEEAIASIDNPRTLPGSTQVPFDLDEEEATVGVIKYRGTFKFTDGGARLVGEIPAKQGVEYKFHLSIGHTVCFAPSPIILHGVFVDPTGTRVAQACMSALEDGIYRARLFNNNSQVQLYDIGVVLN